MLPDIAASISESFGCGCFANAMAALETRLMGTWTLPHVDERTCARLRRSGCGNVYERLREGLRRLLRQVVPDASGDVPVLVWPGEFVRVRLRVRMGRTVGVAFHRNGRGADDRALGQPLFEVGVFRLALGQAQPPTVVVGYDRDMIGVVERSGGAIKRGIIEIPLRRSELPDQLREVVPVFVIADPAAFGGKIKLVPPLQFGLWR